MNKLISLTIIASAGLFLGGCTKSEDSTPTPITNLNEAQEFAQAMQSGKPYYCEMVDEATNTTMAYHLKAGKMHVTTTAPEYSGEMINNLEYIYSWSDQSDEGSKMRIPTEEEMAQLEEDFPTPSDSPSFASESDYQAFQQEGFTISCKAQNIDDSLFTPPNNINFIDPSAMMQGFTDSDGQIDMTQLQEMAKQYESN